MKKRKRKEKDYFYKLKMKNGLYSSILFVAVAIILFTVGFKISNKINQFKEKAIKTEAIITEINYKNEIEREDIKSAYVSYDVNGEEYKTKLNFTSKSMYKGKKVEIYYL